MSKIIILLFIVSNMFATELMQKDILNDRVKITNFACTNSQDCIKILNDLKSQKDLLKFGGFAKELCEIEYDLFDDNEAKFTGCDEFLKLFEAGLITDYRKDIIRYKNITCKLKGIRCEQYGEYIYKNTKNLNLACEYGYEPACYEIY